MYKTIDLFAGAGGLSLGFQQTGEFDILAAAEINEGARLTYKNNIAKNRSGFEFINNIIGYDFKALKDRLGDIDVVIGGPPCQGFSNANRQSKKSHLISMNNGLVKEFFRAIKEISPKVFVMENVGMLQSEKHRFYESSKDVDVIDDLINQGAKIPKREDTIIVSTQLFAHMDLMDIATSEKKVTELLLPYSLQQLLNVLNKNKNHPTRLVNFLNRKKRLIISETVKYLDGLENPNDSQRIISDCLKVIVLSLQNDIEPINIPELTYITSLQKVLNFINEIYENKLLGHFDYSDNKLIYKVKSYSVIDYISAILGNEYVQKGTILNAVDFGVPQERKRFIVIGVKKDILNGRQLDFPVGQILQQPVTVNEAIEDLVKYPASSDVNAQDISYNDQDDSLSDYAIMMRENSISVKNHIMTKSTEEAIERFKQIKQGCNFHSLPDEQKTSYAKPNRTQNTIYLRLNPNEPSGTVVNVRKSMWIHPTLDRAITVREAARLQSFPDSFEFAGSKDSQYQQVGNAVPPLLAKAIAQKVLEYI